MAPNRPMLPQARQWLRDARAVAVLTGAGISAESGVPTFRGPEGLWRQFRPEELATPEAFARDPLLVWEWYDWRRQKIAAVTSNAGHLALAALEKRKERFALITQNVDGLHEAAGSRNVLKIHGDIWRLRCTRCRREWTCRDAPLAELPPHCGCGGLARPGVVWFGEPLPPGVWAKAEEAAAQCEVMLVVGTSAVVYPAAGLVPLARRGGARVIEINREPTPVSAACAASLRGLAGEILPALIAEV
jgi:NAD-dependent deacetylase